MSEPSHIDDLNLRFGIAGVAQVVAGRGAFPKIRLTTSAASAEIYLHGAQVTSWIPAGSDEVIFLSEHSHWQEGRATRGGVPVCFPWFRAKAGDPTAPAHGFVRTKLWQLDSITSSDEGAVTVACSTTSDDATRRWWPHEFLLLHRVTVGKQLRMELIVTNTGSTSFQFEEALHTYFRVGQVQNIRIRGFDGVSYLDNTDANREKLQSGDLVLTTTTDNAYISAHGAAEILDPDLHRTLQTAKENSAATIVWNPWERGAASLADLGNDEWRQMICVEASNILGSAILLETGAEHSMTSTLSVQRE
ncbi:MAG: D-hexose-6-phosphate mutarotase [Terracidiphilus sp.]